MLFNEVEVRFLDDLRRVAEHLDPALYSRHRLGNVVQVGVTGLTSRLLTGTLLQAREVEERVLELFEVELELVSACITDLLDLEELPQELLRHGPDDFIQEQVLVDGIQVSL